MLAGCAEDRAGSVQGATNSAMSGVVRAESTARQSDAAPAGDTQGPDGAGRPGQRPAATLVGQRIEWSQISPQLAEVAGGLVLEEACIELLARRELENRGLSITPEDVAAEETLLTAAMERAGAGGARSSDLIMQMRAARGLGPARYKALLERNAMLRRLVRDESEPTEEQIAQGLTVRYGPRYVARILVTAGQQEAAQVLGRIGQLPPEQRQMAFAAEAFTRSSDPSKDRGGLLEAISPADPTYASAVRAALPGLKVDGLSPIIALDNGYAVLLGAQVIPAQTAPADGRDRVREELRTRLERVGMDQLARRMLLSTPPTIFDSAMNWSWQNRK